MQPFFKNKASNSGKMTLVEIDDIVNVNKEIAKTMNQFFIKGERKKFLKNC